jgi:hypothetical protein
MSRAVCAAASVGPYTIASPVCMRDASTAASDRVAWSWPSARRIDCCVGALSRPMTATAASPRVTG